MDNVSTIALSRLVAQVRTMDVTAANLANTGTPGYRAERVPFSDWLSRQRNVPPGGGTIVYTQDRATYRDRQPGQITHTGNPLDLAIGGDGFFTVQGTAGPRLTRAGHFGLGTDGSVVDENGNGLLDTTGNKIQLAAADTNISVAGDGTISSQNGQVGRIGVVAVTDHTKLQAEGNRLLNATATNTSPVPAPHLIQGGIEESNVQPIREVTRMMNDVRTFQMVSQFLQSESDRQQGAIEKITQNRT
jgi:flagellar basal-body rod protein FlgF